MTSTIDATEGPASLAGDADLLQGAVREAGALALTYFERKIETMRKPDGTPVSEADLAVDRLLHARLTAARPGYGWLSEESADDKSRTGLRAVWVVDPIDGTRGFLEGQTDWTVVVALVVDGRPALASVFNPARDEMFTARRGQGAWLNGRRMTAGDAPAIENARMIAPQKMFRRGIWAEPWPEMQHLRVHSIAYRLALVAAGRAEATISLGEKKEWDIAAPALLVEEAGGLITAIDGSAFTFNKEITRLNGLVAAGHALHELLIARTKQVAAA